MQWKGQVSAMGYSLEEKKKNIVEKILSIDPGVTEDDLMQMIWDELDKPFEEINIEWIHEILDALDPPPLSEKGEAEMIERLSEMFGLND